MKNGKQYIQVGLRLTLTFLFLITNYTLFAQDFQTIYLDRDAHFSTSFLSLYDYGELNNDCIDYAGQDASCLLGIRIDSVDAANPSIHYFPNYIRGVEYNRCPGASWMGDRWIQLADREYFFNGAGDSIVFHPEASLGTTWRLYQFDDNSFFEATVIDLSPEQVLGINDVVKTIVIQRVDLSGNIISHSMNGFEFRLSMNHGFVQTCDLYHFPEDNSLKTLVGMTNPDLGQLLPSKRAIFDFPIGLERHYFRECIPPIGPGAIFVEEAKRYIVLAKNDLNDQLIYDLDYTLFSVVSSGGVSDTVILRDTILITYDVAEQDAFNLMPFEWDHTIIEGEFTSFTYLLNINNRWTKVERPDRVVIDGCLTELLDNTVTDYFWPCVGNRFHALSSFSTFCNQSLVYYDKEGETWGTPIDFETLTSIQNLDLENTAFRIFPNPMSTRIFIETTNPTMVLHEYQLFNIQGQLMQQERIETGTSLTIDVNQLSQGLYFLKLKDTQGKTYLKKVMKE